MVGFTSWFGNSSDSERDTDVLSRIDRDRFFRGPRNEHGRFPAIDRTRWNYFDRGNAVHVAVSVNCSADVRAFLRFSHFGQNQRVNTGFCKCLRFWYRDWLPPLAAEPPDFRCRYACDNYPLFVFKYLSIFFFYNLLEFINKNWRLLLELINN